METMTEKVARIIGTVVAGSCTERLEIAEDIYALYLETYGRELRGLESELSVVTRERDAARAELAFYKTGVKERE
jgi:hypothetical protein